jgi:hypothetical protein
MRFGFGGAVGGKGVVVGAAVGGKGVLVGAAVGDNGVLVGCSDGACVSAASGVAVLTRGPLVGVVSPHASDTRTRIANASAGI